MYVVFDAVCALQEYFLLYNLQPNKNKLEHHLNTFYHTVGLRTSDA
jgi:hypothetical protein